MQTINSFSLQAHNGEYNTWPLQTLLIKNAAPTQAYLPGYQLLHQFQLSSGEFLLITDWDCPFEEATEVLLLSTDLALIARHTFAVPYGSFNLEAIQVIDDANLKLTFYQNDCWQVTILAEKTGLLGSRIKVTQL
jgi:hypothetical protein